MGGTPPEEIDRQHAAAVRLVESGLPCMAAVDHGEIPLSRKSRPTAEDPRYNSSSSSSSATGRRSSDRSDDEEKKTADLLAVSVGVSAGGVDEEDGIDQAETVADDDDDEPCVSSRGWADVGPLAALVSEGYDDAAPKRDGDGGGEHDDAASTASGASMAASSVASGMPGGKLAGVGTTTTTTKKKKKRPKPRTLYDVLKSAPVSSRSNLWDDANAAQNNVHVTRPSHDAWGIKKIILVFCDDFLRDVYEMPWWHSHPELRDAVRPVLDVLGVPPERLVRLLLAALPPGVTIPVHHDTGEWVRHTHRVHVPVIVSRPDRVLFRCGPTEDGMRRVNCKPGHVFELNNQSKHAVSNCSSEHRVHLILDYVDGSFDVRRRIRLEPGERLLQTRRSIDRVADAGTRPCPSYLILGAQKAGTTSLYDYLNQHPLVVRAHRRETHNLDWRWDETLKTTEQRRKHCLGFFYANELRYHPSCLTGESTPSYLLDSRRVIPRLKEVYPHPIKFIVMMRDPVRRAHSHYAMVTSLDGNPEQIKTRGTEWLDKSFEEVVRMDVDNMKEDGLIPYWDAETETLDAEVFEEFVGSKEEAEAWGRYLSRRVPLNTGSHTLVGRGFYALQLRPWLDAFPSHRFLMLKLEDMSRDQIGVQGMVDRALQHLDLPLFKVNDDTAKNTRLYEPMAEQTANMLEKFYEPHNRRLARLMAEEMREEGWQEPWPYS